MNTIFIHPHAGVLSASGMGLADMRALREKAVELTLNNNNLSDIQNNWNSMANTVHAELIEQGVDESRIDLVKRAQLRYDGTDTTMDIIASSLEAMSKEFIDRHQQQFGFVMDDRDLIIEAITVEAIGHTDVDEDPELTRPADCEPAQPLSTVNVFTDNKDWSTPLFDRDKLSVLEKITGPAIIIDSNTTTMVEPGWSAEITAKNHLVLRRTTPRTAHSGVNVAVDPILLEIFNNLFMSIAEQMGGVLANTSHSVNIKERFDFSCAVFDAEGNLVANAPHMPVHLGSMSDSVRAVMDKWSGQMQSGDVFVVNAPYNGGTHLPDVTAITPVFDDKGDIIFYVGSRGHHADIGGITPGSMPPYSKHVDEEGVLLDNLRLVKAGTFLESDMHDVLASGRFPARNIEQNMADLRAQVAANEKGLQELHRMINHYGQSVVLAYMKHVQDNAEHAVRKVISTLSSGKFSYPMDTGAKVEVEISIHPSDGSATLDFSATSLQQDNNFNAPLSICHAAALYVFRTLVDDNIPMNEGCLKPLKLIVPEGSMLNPVYPAAVVAGNVEVSQAIVDTLYGALGVMGASQGTMNNFTFGDDDNQYNETICGGSGAGPGFNGTDAVQTHMTNSRLTDPEILEWRYPVMLDSFEIRRNSGGDGEYKGGNGVIRKIRFLDPMTAAILSGHRDIPPYGAAGGKPGVVGANRIMKANGQCVILPGSAQAEMEAGDVFIIETPGGGGYKPSTDSKEFPPFHD